MFISVFRTVLFLLLLDLSSGFEVEGLDPVHGTDVSEDTSCVSMLQTQISIASMSLDADTLAASARHLRSVRHRTVGPVSEVWTPSLLEAAKNDSANETQVLAATGGSTPRRQTVVAYGTDGSKLTFDTNFSTKLCETVTAAELPHLSSQYIAEIQDMFKYNPPNPKPVCASAFGVLIVVAGLKTPYEQYSQEAFAQLSANMVAAILDQDGDGVADDSETVGKMRTGPQGHWIHLKRSGIRKEMDWVKKLGSTVQISEQHDFKAGMPIWDTTRNMFEETYHTYQHAREQAFPDVFGFKEDCNDSPATCTWSGSLAQRCAASAQCNWYRHNECTCSKTGEGSTAADITQGDCSTPSCAGIEWDYNVEMTFSGNPGMSHFGPDNANVWKNSSSIESKLNNTGSACTAFLAALRNPKYHILQKKVTFGSAVTKNGNVHEDTNEAHEDDGNDTEYTGEDDNANSLPAGIAACEDQGFTATQCQAVGCCVYESGQCWANDENRCQVEDTNEAHEDNGNDTEYTGNNDNANSLPAGIDACEDQGFTMQQCQAVGCCLFEDGQCWAKDADSCNTAVS